MINRCVGQVKRGTWDNIICKSGDNHGTSKPGGVRGRHGYQDGEKVTEG